MMYYLYMAVDIIRIIEGEILFLSFFQFHFVFIFELINQDIYTFLK